MKKLMLAASLTAAANAGLCVGARAQMPAAEPAMTPATTPSSVAAPVDTSADANNDIGDRAPLPVIALPGEAPPAVPQEKAPERHGIAEVIVTAQRREQSAQDVPISMTVLDQQQLTNANVTNTSDLANYTPSLSVNTRFGNENATFAIRGFTQDLRTTASVATYFAEVVAPRGQSVQGSGDGAGPGMLFDLENVQVLKGPQGTLFGRNTTGGAVLIVPKKPTDHFEGYVELSGGDYDMRRAQGVINLPLAESFKLRLGVDANKRDGHLRNITGVGADDLGNTDYVSTRLSAVWNPVDTFENYTIATYVDSDTHGYTAQLYACNPNPLKAPLSVLTGLACPAQLARQAADGDDGFYDVASSVARPVTTIKELRVINTSTWDISDELTAKNIAAYGHLETENASDIFGTNFRSFYDLNPDRRFTAGISVNNPDFPVTDQTTWVEELQFQGRAFDSRLQWQAGAYYEHSLPNGFSGNNSTALISCEEGSLEKQPSDYNCFDPTAGLLSGVINYKFKTDYLNQAVYAQATYDIIDELSVTGGLRYTWDRTRGLGYKTRYRFALAVPIAPVESESSPEVKSEAPTGVIELSYKPARGVLAYAKYVRGYRQGSVNMASDPGIDTYDPEKVDTYEVGSKLTFGGVIPGRVSVAAFYNDLTDMQLQAGYVSFAPTTAIFNAGKATIKGVEAEAFIEPLRNLTLGLSYAYLDTKLVKQEDRRAEVLAAAGVIGGLTYTPIADQGDTLPFAADHTVVASLNYRLPLSEKIGDVDIGATYSYVGTRRTAATSSTPFDELDPFELLNLNLNWGSMFTTPIDLSIFATNVLDEKYVTYSSGTYNALGFDSRMVGLPRMYGARLKYRFGS